ncbi:hypothetical protein M8J76_014404 [Diaphorina citri]|nr:hypothetical protein M8J75_015350 [Diaphorina citri]KAI5724030.1 hypothetical protein M8J76_014404 [Diaphorina citri]KAI5728922.1 hypothetical protein M8J77_023335 [Diaphorina citri]
MFVEPCKVTEVTSTSMELSRYNELMRELAAATCSDAPGSTSNQVASSSSHQAASRDPLVATSSPYQVAISSSLHQIVTSREQVATSSILQSATSSPQVATSSYQVAPSRDLQVAPSSSLQVATSSCPPQVATCSSSGSDPSLCPTHNKEFTIWCFECKEKICSDCVTKREKLGHSTHVIIPLADKINYEVQSEMTRKKGLAEMVNSYSARFASYMSQILQCYDNVKKEMKCNNEYVAQEYSTMFPPADLLKILKYENVLLEEKCTAYPFQNLILEKLLTSPEVLNPEQLKLIVDNYVAANHIETRKLDIGFASGEVQRQSAVVINYLTVQRYIFDRKKKELAEYIALVNYADQPEQPTPSQLSARTSISSTTSSSSFPSSPSSSLLRTPPSSNPRFYFDIALHNTPQGRIIIETYPSVAPRMATNFELLTIGEFPGLSYRNCALSQLWQFESIITGSFRYGDKTEGRSVFVQEYFRPDESHLGARRGAVGMRRIKKTSENKGLVGSQFRIILNHQKQFTGIFGQVIYGLEYIDAISTYSNAQGQPTERFYISNCGKWEG